MRIKHNGNIYECTNEFTINQLLKYGGEVVEEKKSEPIKDDNKKKPARSGRKKRAE